MPKLDEFISKYAKEAGLTLEADQFDDAFGPKKGSDLADNPTAELPKDAATDIEPAAPEEKKSLTDIGYVTAVKDMVKLLSISPSDIPESEYDIFDTDIKPENAFEMHQKLRDMIDRHYVA